MPVHWVPLGNFIGPTGPTGATGPPGATGATGPTGQGLTWKGAWAIGTAYVAYDVVSRNGSSYINILANTGSDPATDGGTHWQIVAQIGATGTTGSTGATGSQGIQGVTGATGPTGSRGSIYQPGVANFGALPVIDGTIVALGDLCFDAAGNLYQVQA